MKIAASICTHNRAQSLDRTLYSLLGLKIPPQLQWEVLVVANDCDDATHEIANRYSLKLPLRLIPEKQRGLSFARNRAIAEAVADAILWLDDDVEVDPALLHHYVDAFERYPDADFFAGAIDARFEGKAKPWLGAAVRLLPTTFSQLNLGPTTRPLDAEQAEYPYGANMLVRTRALHGYSFQCELGRDGNAIPCGGEEIALFRHLYAQNKTGVWVPDAVVEHWIPRERQTIAYLEKYWTGIGIQEVRLSNSSSGINLASRLKNAKRLAIYRLARQLSLPRIWLPYLSKVMLERGRRSEVFSASQERK